MVQIWSFYAKVSNLHVKSDRRRLSAVFWARRPPRVRASTAMRSGKWLVNQVRTEYHPAATCAMLPQSQGGVVNAKLQVYGLGTYVFF